MQTIPFSEIEIELAIELNKKGIPWRPKSSDWFIDLSNLRVLYSGEYVQSVSLSLVTDEDGRSFSFLELLIDGEENGNRMKRSLSYSDQNKFGQMNWLPAIKDCIDIIDNHSNFRFLSLEKIDNLTRVTAVNQANNEKVFMTGETELIACYKLILEYF